MERVEEAGNVEQDEETLLKRPHGRPWVDQEAQLVDPAAADKFIGKTRLLLSGALQDKRVQDRTPFDFFQLLFPGKLVWKTLEATNEAMQEKAQMRRNGSTYATLTHGELLKWFGIELAMAVQPVSGGIDIYWAEERLPNQSLRGLAFGKWSGMSKNRFLLIKECLRFKPGMDENGIDGVRLTYYGDSHTIHRLTTLLNSIFNLRIRGTKFGIWSLILTRIGEI